MIAKSWDHKLLLGTPWKALNILMCRPNPRGPNLIVRGFSLGIGVSTAPRGLTLRWLRVRLESPAAGPPGLSAALLALVFCLPLAVICNAVFVAKNMWTWVWFSGYSVIFLFSFVFVSFDQFIIFGLQHEIAQVVLKMKLGWWHSEFRWEREHRYCEFDTGFPSHHWNIAFIF